jgi:peptidoglycan/LPS O-acetylase OafA/YrhL
MQRSGGEERVLGLDILRSTAIILVILSHYANNVSFWYGYVPPPQVFFSGDLGVDLFFILSGFLIGRILIDITTRTPTPRNLLLFLVRRWMRTFPAYFVWLAALAIFFPPTYGVADNLLHFATFTQNLFQPMPPEFWYAVSWSLTIEEWFYLLFGTGFFIAAMLLRRRWAIWIPLGVMLAGPPLLRLSVPYDQFITAGYYKMIPFRLDEIGYGVILAWLYRRRSKLFAHPWPLLALGLCLILEAWVPPLPLPARFYQVFQNDMAAIGCALCLPAFLLIHRAPRWLERPVRHVSRVSYSLYLVHLTFLVDVATTRFLHGSISAHTALLISVTGMVVAAELMSRLVEQPAMRWRPRQSSQPSTGPIVSAPGLL